MACVVPHHIHIYPARSLIGRIRHEGALRPHVPHAGSPQLCFAHSSKRRRTSQRSRCGRSARGYAQRSSSRPLSIFANINATAFPYIKTRRSNTLSADVQPRRREAVVSHLC